MDVCHPCSFIKIHERECFVGVRRNLRLNKYTIKLMEDKVEWGGGIEDFLQTQLTDVGIFFYFHFLIKSYQGGREHWTVNYTCTQSLIRAVFHLLSRKLWVLLLHFGWFKPFNQ